jgi:DNA-binding NarL/FixJ family response regulator
MNRYFNESLLPVLQSRSLGTLGATGYKFEPEDTVAKLHKGERVLNPQEASEYNRNSNQTIPNEKLDQLNNTMMQVVALLAQGNQISERTAKGLRGMTNDYYRGMA